MAKSAPVVLALCILAGALSACEVSAVPVAARVNGVAITVSSLDADLNTAANDAGYRCFLNAQAQQQSQSGISVFGAGSGTFASSFVASQLGFLADGEAVHLGLPSVGIGAAPPLALTAARAELFGQFTPQTGGSCKTRAQVVFDGLEPGFRNTLLEYYADETTAAAHLAHLNLTTAGVHAYESAHPQDVVLDCIDAVITKTKAQATEVQTQLDKGANFAAVAKANSIDTASAQNGGRVGCLNPSGLEAPVGPDVAKLKIGEISAPISLGTEFVVAEVVSRSFPSVPNAIIQVINPEYSNVAFSNLLDAIIEKAKVEISPPYGTVKISSAGITVTPLPGPKETFVPNFGADIASHN